MFTKTKYFQKFRCESIRYGWKLHDRKFIIIIISNFIIFTFRCHHKSLNQMLPLSTIICLMYNLLDVFDFRLLYGSYYLFNYYLHVIEKGILRLEESLGLCLRKSISRSSIRRDMNKTLISTRLIRRRSRSIRTNT